MIRLALDLLNGLPTIVVGLFVFGLLMMSHHQVRIRRLAGAATMMLPLIAAEPGRAASGPADLREAADALGVSRARSDDTSCRGDGRHRDRHRAHARRAARPLR